MGTLEKMIERRTLVANKLKYLGYEWNENRKCFSKRKFFKGGFTTYSIWGTINKLDLNSVIGQHIDNERHYRQHFYFELVKPYFKTTIA
jgi:hypothetical protein